MVFSVDPSYLCGTSTLHLRMEAFKRTYTAKETRKKIIFYLQIWTWSTQRYLRKYIT